MAKRRIVEVEVESRDATLWWTLGGAAVGLLVGVIIAERMSGRKFDPSALLRRAKRMVRLAGTKWQPLLDAALQLKEMWEDRRETARAAARAGDPDDLDDLDDEYLEEFEDLTDADEYEEASPPFALDDEEDEDEGDDEAEEEEESEIAARVLEAFVNDPILAERAVEIDADERGNVFLHGSVRTAREVAHAVTIAGGVPGVTGVRQRLRVRNRR